MKFLQPLRDVLRGLIARDLTQAASFQQRDHRRRYCVQLRVLSLAQIRATLQELRYDLPRFHHVVHLLEKTYALQLLASSQRFSLQPSCALQLRDRDDLQPSALDLYLLSDAYCFHQCPLLGPSWICALRLLVLHYRPWLLSISRNRPTRPLCCVFNSNSKGC